MPTRWRRSAHLQAGLGDKAEPSFRSNGWSRCNRSRRRPGSTWGFLQEERGSWHRPKRPFAVPPISTRLDRAWYGLALCLIRLRRFDDAVVALRKNTELQPMSPYGWYQLARVHVDRQEPEEAAKIIRHLRKFEPKVAAQLERETGLGAAPT
jgi:tetratricopeptide (TPR) repeat protein